ncbi:hypothetical protein WN944_000852 [Citrus x changshan-huyou]|uniref:Uncharacterized protein n=1 Tax=Citrus x changshan-huyou TaxID=2935761 RepID=A0AAP0QQT7_9ROSI
MASEEESAVKEPLDLIKLSLDERIYVMLRSDSELRAEFRLRNLSLKAEFGRLKAEFGRNKTNSSCEVSAEEY